MLIRKQPMLSLSMMNVGHPLRYAGRKKCYWALAVLLLIGWSQPAPGQIKIGDNPQTIHNASVLELESLDRVLVITRVNEEQMNAIHPSPGALVFNTDSGCIHYYSGMYWKSLCRANGFELSSQPLHHEYPSVLLTEMNDILHLEVGEISGVHIADSSISGTHIQDNTITGNLLAPDSVGADALEDQSVGDAEMDFSTVTLGDFTNDAGYLTVSNSISNADGNVLVNANGAYYSDSAIKDQLAANTTAIAGDSDRDPTNEIQVLQLNGDQLSISGGNSIDLGSLGNASGDKQFLTLNGSLLAIENGNSVDLSAFLDNSDRQQLSIAGNLLSLTNSEPVLLPASGPSTTALQAGANISISGDGSATDPYVINSALIERDSSTSNELISHIELDDSGILRIAEGGNSFSIDLGTLGGTSSSPSISQVLSRGNDAASLQLKNLGEPSEPQDAATRSYVDSRIVNAGSGVSTDELNLAFEVVSGSLQITDNGGTLSVPVAAINSDAQLLTSNNSPGSLSISGGNTIALNVNDADFDPGNELQELTSADGTVQISRSGINFDLSVNTNGTDNQDIQGSGLSGEILTIGIEGGQSEQIDLSLFATDVALATAVDASEAADGDRSNTNELQAISSPDGSVLVTREGNDYELRVQTSGGLNLSNTDLTQTGGDRIYDLDGQNLSFDGPGNLGIGNRNPQSKLHVSGEVRSSGYANSNGVANEPSYAFTNDPDTGMWRGANVNYLRFSTDGTEALTITPAQDIGIGTSSPTEKLHVMGNILASGSISPDYVFHNYFSGESTSKPDYEMKNLWEVAEFIRLHRHLPGVPSSREVEEKGGIVVNRATEINLEKIEELFLYTIEQEKKIGRMRSELKALAGKLEEVSCALRALKKSVKSEK